MRHQNIKKMLKKQQNDTKDKGMKINEVLVEWHGRDVAFVSYGRRVRLRIKASFFLKIGRLANHIQ